MGESSHLKHTCFHCGNTGLLIVKYKGSEAFGGLYPDGDYDLRQNYTWYLLSCPVCRMLTLYQAYSDESMQVPTEHGWEIIEDYSTLYPQCSIDYDGVPREIKSAFEAALKVKNLDHSICLMALRRVLEAVCDEKQAKGNNLFEQVNSLIQSGLLPQMFSDACWVIRKLGNQAAHKVDNHFYQYQVEQTIEFVEVILKYLYVLPQKMKSLKASIEGQLKREN